MNTFAAREFVTEAQGWDTPDAFTQTARRGLSTVDQATLRALCAETGEDYAAAEADVLAWVREKVDALDAE